jgi:hypothetical protein
VWFMACFSASFVVISRSSQACGSWRGDLGLVGHGRAAHGVHRRLGWVRAAALRHHWWVGSSRASRSGR